MESHRNKKNFQLDGGLEDMKLLSTYSLFLKKKKPFKTSLIIIYLFIFWSHKYLI